MALGLLKTLNGFNLRVSVLAGASADTNIAVSGIATEDTIIAALEFATAASIATLTDRTATTNITSAGNVQCTVDTSNDAILLLWVDASA